MTTLPLPLILAATLLFQAADKPFSSDAGNFKIAMPGVPKEQTIKVASPIGPIETHIFMVEQDGASWAAVYNDYPDQVAQADSDKILEGAVKGTVGNIQGKVVSKKDIKVDGFPGKEFEATIPAPGGGTATYRGRTILVQKRLYQLVLTGKDAQVKTKAGDAFLGSFALIKKPTP